MTDTRAAVLSIIARVAPGADLRAVEDDDDLRDAFDIDSMDMLLILVSVSEELGVDVPEADYGEAETLGRLVAYIDARRAGGRAGAA